jgi:RHS repeat-associated protein
MKNSWRKVLAISIFSMTFLACAHPARAQNYFYEYGIYPWSNPVPVPGGYVDAANGNLHIEIPITSLAERGQVPFVASMVYDSHIWVQEASGSSSLWAPANPGWRLVTSGSPGGASYVSQQAGVCETDVNHKIVITPWYKYVNWTWQAPDGRIIPFNTVSTLVDPCGGSVLTSSGLASDGSGYQMYVTGAFSATVYAPSGLQAYPEVKDTNGNYYSSANNYSDVKDTLGRTPITTSVNGSTTTYAVLNSQNTTYNYVVTWETIPVSTSFGQSGVTECTTNCTITVVEKIELPDTTTYQFTYDQGATGTHYGTLTQMTLPTGGVISYTNTNYKDGWNNQNLYLTSAAVTGGGTWTFAPVVTTSGCPSTCFQQSTVTLPSGDQQSFQYEQILGSMWDLSETAGDQSMGFSYTWSTTGPPSVFVKELDVSVTTPSGALDKKTTFAFDTNNHGTILTTNEWNFGSTSQTPDRITTYTYLANSNVNMLNKKSSVKVTNGAGTAVSETDITYDGSALTTVSGAAGHDDTNFGSSYTPRGNPTLISVNTYGSPATLTTSMTYDTTGQMLTSVDSNGNTTKYSYTDCYENDAQPPTTYAPSAITNAFATTITLPASGTVSSCYYYGDGKLAKATDQNANSAVYHYLDINSWDRQTHVIPPLGWEEWVYSATEKQVDSYIGIGDTAPSSSCSSCRHDENQLDSLGRLSQTQLVSDPDGANTSEGTVTYDTNGRVSVVTYPCRPPSTCASDTYAYEPLSRVKQVQHADSNTTKTFYGSAITSSGLTGYQSSQLCATATYGFGYPVLYVDESGKMREIWTDGFGRTIEVDEPGSTGALTSNTCYSYDTANRLTAVAHTVGSSTQTRSYAYDGLSRVTSATAPETNNSATSYYYTTSAGALCSGNPGALCRRTDPRGTTITYTYDAIGRLTGKTYSDTTHAVTYAYDQSSANGLTITNGKGRKTSMTDASGITAWSYDANGRIVTEQRTIAGITKAISYAYNGDSSLKSVTYPSGRVVNYVVGDAEREQSATDANGTQYAVTASYAATGGLSNVIYGQVTGGFGGMNVTEAYDIRLDLTSIEATSAAGKAINLGYCFYQWVSNVCQTGSSNTNNGSVTVIANNNDTGRTQTFAYDPLNRISSATTQATSGADCWGQSFVVDPLANLTTISSTQTGCSIATLSATASVTTNQLGFTPAPSYDLAGNMTNDGSYAYTFDAENHITSGNAVTYTYDGNGMRVEKSSGTLYWRAITGDVLAETDTSGNTKNEYIYFAGQRVAWWSGSGGSASLYYIYSDALGTTRTITESNGTVCYDADFTPYGQELTHTNNCPSTYNYKFTGYERDTETQLDYAFARYYNSRLGRFMSADPMDGSLGNPQSLNRYAYAVNNPANFIDPLGLYCVDKNGNQIPGITDASGCDPSIGVWVTVDGNSSGNTTVTVNGGAPLYIDPATYFGGTILTGSVTGSPFGGSGQPSQRQTPTCTAAQKAAAALAKAFENTSKTTQWIAFGFGVGTALAGAGEGVSLGFDTPVTISFGSATGFFGTASFLTGSAAAVLNSFASGNIQSMLDFNWGQLTNVATAAAASKIPGVGPWAETIGELAEQGRDLSTNATEACPQ